MGARPPEPYRLARCCYCGARSTLPPAGSRKALVCHGCGAPILVIEALGPAAHRERPGRSRPPIPHPAERRGQHLPKDRPVRRRKGKARPGLFARLSRMFDELDDLDDILDLFD